MIDPVLAVFCLMLFLIASVQDRLLTRALKVAERLMDRNERLQAELDRLRGNGLAGDESIFTPDAEGDWRE